ncbi:unnamed protein product [Symbiodinium sp. CCMP2592]|nr:unnamed protein product [Symbiodinium sp. CCMP2592]
MGLLERRWQKPSKGSIVRKACRKISSKRGLVAMATCCPIHQCQAWRTQVQGPLAVMMRRKTRRCHSQAQTA